MMPRTPRITDSAIPAPARDLCFAFADTRSWRGTPRPADELQTIEDILAWIGRETGISHGLFEAARARWTRHPAEAAEAFLAAIALREAIYRMFSNVAEETAPRAEDLAELNAALAAAPSRSRLVPAGTGHAWQAASVEPALPLLLAGVIWSAADLLAQPPPGRIRRCANEKCLWLFLDDSKSGNRRWCAMSACGNRAKAHRHYLRQKLPAG
ncbi:MAG TPA: ABATE domain-containing protein [Acetobacteraceae bacterium]|nr:ABATE domain-containing protein [Acetobacteraceae bacterium]